ncbi:alkaline phosphatase family protein [Nocardioides terrae]|uniref:alkaline phosphatase family protein n=1 Tax=Nocardioides terrae TaxID=574651 RepID=UPI00111330EA|nr:alkaline phosphatase family protein [Nocardioides terrae]
MAPDAKLLTRLLAGCAVGTLLLGVAGCGSDADSTAAPSEAASLTAAAPGSPAAPVSPAAPARADRSAGVTKVVVFMVENHSLVQMRAGMPKVYGFAARHAYATDYRAIRHPSLPNYIAIAAGSTLGVADDADPSAHRLTGNNVFRQALRSGHTAKVYAESMPRRCALTNSGRYAVRHNPWTYFSASADRAACKKYDVRAGRLARDSRAGSLPNVGFVIPDIVDDAHDGTLAQADAWISRQIGRLTAGPDWRAGRLAIVVTADEDDSRSGNKVLTVVATKDQPRRAVATPLDHYSLTGFLEDVLHVRHLRHARTAPSLAQAFGVKVG